MTASATARARARRELRPTAEASMSRVARPKSESAPRRREPGSAPHLRVVPQPAARSRTTSRATLVVMMLAVFTIGVIVFQATIAEQQLRLDALTTDLRLAEVHHDYLRQERAELLSPSRLREEAVMMGMYQGMSTKFAAVPAEIVADVMASTAKMNPLFADPPPAVASAGAIAQTEPIGASQP